MTDPLSKLRRIVIHRGDVARRWFGLRTVEQVMQFVYDDPDVQAQLNNPVVVDAAVREGMLAVISDVYDGRQEHRPLLRPLRRRIHRQDRSGLQCA
jgi:hypothetical protein